MTGLNHDRMVQMGLVALAVSILGPVVCPAGASDWEKDAEKLCNGWGEQAEKRRYCVSSVTTCLLYRESATRKPHFEPCMEMKSGDLPPGTEWRAVLAGGGAEGGEILHGSYRQGVLRCDPGYYRNSDGDDCPRLPEVDGGEWKNNALYCDNGYVMMVERERGEEISPEDQSCRKLPEIPNAVYRGSKLSCTGGYVLVEGPECVSQSTVRDPSQILTNLEWQKHLCPEGYRESSGVCYHTGLKAKSVMAGNMELQGLQLGMREREVPAILEANGYSEVGYGFTKTERDGTKKTIEYKVGVGASNEDKYRRLVRISYKQDYPTSLRFDIEKIEAKMKQRFGEPDEQKKGNEKEFSIAYRDGGVSSNAEPILYINGRKDFRGQFLTMALQDPGLQQRLQDEHRAEAEATKQKAELAKPAASIDF